MCLFFLQHSGKRKILLLCFPYSIQNQGERLLRSCLLLLTRVFHCQISFSSFWRPLPFPFGSMLNCRPNIMRMTPQNEANMCLWKRNDGNVNAREREEARGNMREREEGRENMREREILFSAPKPVEAG